jgi:hypothetical protein
MRNWWGGQRLNNLRILKGHSVKSFWDALYFIVVVPTGCAQIGDGGERVVRALQYSTGSYVALLPLSLVSVTLAAPTVCPTGSLNF